MAKIDRPEARLSHYVAALLERVVVEPCWFTAIDGAQPMGSQAPGARARWEQQRRAMGVKPAHLDWYIYQVPKFAQLELKIASPVSANQQATIHALTRNGIPAGVCRSVIDVWRFLNAEGFALHDNGANIAHEVEARWRAAQDTADIKKAAPAKPKAARKPRAPRPSLADVARGLRWAQVRP